MEKIDTDYKQQTWIFLQEAIFLCVCDLIAPLKVTKFNLFLFTFILVLVILTVSGPKWRSGKNCKGPVWLSSRYLYVE